MHGIAGEHLTKDKRYQYDRQNRECDKCKPKLQELRRQRNECEVQKKAIEKVAESRGLQLFYCLKEAKNYDAARGLYNELMKTRDSTKHADETFLDLQQSYAAMLIEEKKFPEAEPIIRAVWGKRTLCAGPSSEVVKESHRQLCFVLCALKRYEEAAGLHRTIFEGKMRGSWALENGDELCQRLREQGRIRRAKDLQDEVWKARKEQNGPRDGLTIQSVLRLIADLDELVKTIDNGAGTDAERSRNGYNIKAYQCEIEVALQEVWANSLHPEPVIGILDAGHRLGIILFNRERFLEAEIVFKPVWDGKKQQLRDDDLSMIATSSMLGKALYHQGRPETYYKAANILEATWQMARTKGHPETISCGECLAGAYRSLGDWLNTERIYEWVVQHKGQHGFPAKEVDDACWNLGQALFNQGRAKDPKTVSLLHRLYERWKANPPDFEKPLQCGHMLAELLSRQDGETDEALEFARYVFKKRGDSGKMDVTYLDSARLYGSLFMKGNKILEAEEILKSMWEQRTQGTEEKKMRVRCGHLYGQALVNRKKHSNAKKILELVADAQGEVSARADEVEETRKLLGEVQQKIEKERKKRSSPQWKSYHRHW